MFKKTLGILFLAAALSLGGCTVAVFNYEAPKTSEGASATQPDKGALRQRWVAASNQSRDLYQQLAQARVAGRLTAQQFVEAEAARNALEKALLDAQTAITVDAAKSLDAADQAMTALKAVLAKATPAAAGPLPVVPQPKPAGS